MPYDTPLTPEEEAAFQQWKALHAPNDSGVDYDLRGAWKYGAKQAANGHWPDTYKKPNHPTFSKESIYAADRPDLAGQWSGDTYLPSRPELYEGRNMNENLLQYVDPQNPSVDPNYMLQSYGDIIRRLLGMEPQGANQQYFIGAPRK